MASLSSYAASASESDRDRPAPPSGLAWIDGEVMPGAVCTLESVSDPGFDWVTLCDDGRFELGPTATSVTAKHARALLAEADRLALQALAGV